MGKVFVLVVTVLFLLVLIGTLLGLLPGYEQVDSDSFVYPADGAVVLVTTTGEYVMVSQGDGCYRLTQPEPGQARGTAELVYPMCGW